MSAIGEAVLRRLVSLRRSQPDGSTPESWQNYIQWQFNSSRALFAKYPKFEIRDRRVLEIGCGTGGRSRYLASHGASEVVGIDINAEEIALARQYVVPTETYQRLTFCVAPENQLLDIGTFDVVVLVDCMEHVVSPPAMLRLAHGYTKPGGVCYFSSVGYYHYLGSHMPLIPFSNVLFSDETIINVYRWRLSQLDYVPSRFDSDPPTKRWEGIYNLRDRPGEHLNKITIREMKRLLRYGPFRESAITVLGFGHARPLFRLLDPLRHIPIAQEIYHSLVIGRCQR